MKAKTISILATLAVLAAAFAPIRAEARPHHGGPGCDFLTGLGVALGIGIVAAAIADPAPVVYETRTTVVQPAPVVYQQPAPIVYQQPVQTVVYQQPAQQTVVYQQPAVQTVVYQEPAVVYEPAPVIAPVFFPAPPMFHPAPCPPPFCGGPRHGGFDGPRGGFGGPHGGFGGPRGGAPAPAMRPRGGPAF